MNPAVDKSSGDPTPLPDSRAILLAHAYLGTMHGRGCACGFHVPAHVLFDNVWAAWVDHLLAMAAITPGVGMWLS